MNRKYKINKGFVLPLVIVAMIILSVLAIGTMMSSYGSRVEAVKTKAQTEAMLAAEAGYERAIFWMCQQNDILGALQGGGGSGALTFGTSSCNYSVSFHDFMGARPVFQVTSVGKSGRPIFTRVVDVSVVQETAGWAMGACMVPYDSTTTGAVNFKASEIIDMPLHINKGSDSPDNKDIFIDMSGSPHPQFRRRVEMGESRKRVSSSYDKYTNPDNVIPCFTGGIYFDQPGIRIMDESAVQSKVNRFRDSTNPIFKFEPNGVANIPFSNPGTNSDTTRLSAVQLEFFVQGGVGKVRITNNCTVLGYRRKNDDYTWDFNTVPGSGGNTFQRYFIYAYHYAPDFSMIPSPQTIVPITDTYVTQTFGGYTSAPGGQIYVNGNVIIGSGDDVNIPDPNMVVKGKITVVATGNIWIGDNIVVDDASGTQRDANGMPTANNPNVLGLIAKGVVKVVDPGMSTNGASETSDSGSPNYYPRDVNFSKVSTKIGATVDTTKKHYYQPIGIRNAANPTTDRKLPHSTVVEAAITVGGGGWGAENVARGSYGGRKEYTSGTMDNLVVHGSITEVVRGVVGMPSSNDGYNKYYYIDNRLMSGILPADIWFTGKYIPSPAGWSDHSVGN